MTTQTKDLLALADTLENFNKWRRGDDDSEQPHPAGIGMALDKAIEFIRASATSEPEQTPISDEELDLMSEKALFCRISRQQFARSIEAAHGIGTTPQPAEGNK